MKRMEGNEMKNKTKTHEYKNVDIYFKVTAYLLKEASQIGRQPNIRTDRQSKSSSSTFRVLWTQ